MIPRVPIQVFLALVLPFVPTPGHAQVSDRERMRQTRALVLSQCGLEGSQFTVEERVDGPVARFSPSLTDDQQRCISGALGRTNVRGLSALPQRSSTRVNPPQMP